MSKRLNQREITKILHGEDQSNKGKNRFKTDFDFGQLADDDDESVDLSCLLNKAAPITNKPTIPKLDLS
jgi:hypothetical protein